MSLLWADFPSGSQGLYGDAESVVNDGTPWITIMGSTLQNDPDPLVGSAGRALLLDNSLNNNVFESMTRLALSSITAGVGVSFRLFTGAFHATGSIFIAAIVEADNSDGYWLSVEPNGALTVGRRTGSGSTRSTLASTTTPVITPNAWWHISFKANATTGAVSVQVNGVEVLSATDGAPVSTGVLGLAMFGMRTAGGSGITAYIKDLVVWNTEGSANNDHPGQVSVFFKSVDSDITLGGWTTSSGSSGTDLIGNEGPPVDTNYVSASDAPPAAMEYTLENLPEDITSVRGIISVVRAAKVDGGDGNLQVSLSPNGSDYDDGDDRAITTAFTYWWDVSETNPATSAAWTPSEFDGARIKINRTL